VLEVENRRLELKKDGRLYLSTDVETLWHDMLEIINESKCAIITPLLCY